MQMYPRLHQFADQRLVEDSKDGMDDQFTNLRTLKYAGQNRTVGKSKYLGK
jgi:hypothetical protein